MYIILLIVAVFTLFPTMVCALEPAEVAVVANRAVDEGVDLARYYMGKRGIPEDNLILVDTTRKELCSRDEYDKEIAAPVRDFLRKNDRKAIRCLVTMFGVPLKVASPAMTSDEKARYRELNSEKKETWKALKSLPDAKSPEAKELERKLELIEQQRRTLDRRNQSAAVDSELTLLKNDSYSLENWLPNPFFIAFQKKLLSIERKDVLLVSRLDAPAEKIVRRMIDDSIAAEAQGLEGKAYFDARWAKSDKPNLKGYAFYDNSLHRAAEQVRLRGISVVVNDKQALFQAGEAPRAALYCGWYSYGRYIDAFDWQPGAVGYHIASGECGTLRPGSSRGWCKMMLEDGVAATIGPVGEPYVQAFPVPEAFFGLLTDGGFTLAEAYFLSTPYLSWRMVLLGDPLYRPYKKRTAQTAVGPSGP
jgi:uncharacterized protein (TIGR03790 family)